MKKVKIISQSKNGFVEIVIKKVAGKRKDGTQKYSSKTYHIPEYKIQEFKNKK